MVFPARAGGWCAHPCEFGILSQNQDACGGIAGRLMVNQYTQITGVVTCPSFPIATRAYPKYPTPFAKSAAQRTIRTTPASSQ